MFRVTEASRVCASLLECLERCREPSNKAYAFLDLLMQLALRTDLCDSLDQSGLLHSVSVYLGNVRRHWCFHLLPIRAAISLLSLYAISEKNDAGSTTTNVPEKKDPGLFEVVFAEFLCEALSSSFQEPFSLSQSTLIHEVTLALNELSKSQAFCVHLVTLGFFQQAFVYLEKLQPKETLQSGSDKLSQKKIDCLGLLCTFLSSACTYAVPRKCMIELGTKKSKINAPNFLFFRLLADAHLHGKCCRSFR